MSEYIEIDADLGDGGEVVFTTNLPLTAEGRAEQYASADALAEGSPVAQALAAVPGITSLWMSGGDIVATVAPDTDWHAIVADVNAALKEFFL